MPYGERAMRSPDVRQVCHTSPLICGSGTSSRMPTERGVFFKNQASFLPPSTPQGGRANISSQCDIDC
jgi:hypothetical protein